MEVFLPRSPTHPQFPRQYVSVSDCLLSGWIKSHTPFSSFSYPLNSDSGLTNCFPSSPQSFDVTVETLMPLLSSPIACLSHSCGSTLTPSDPPPEEYFIFHYFLVTPHCMCNLSPPVRDQTCTPCSRSMDLNQWTTRGVPSWTFLQEVVLMTWKDLAWGVVQWTSQQPHYCGAHLIFLNFYLFIGCSGSPLLC